MTSLGIAFISKVESNYKHALFTLWTMPHTINSGTEKTTYFVRFTRSSSRWRTNRSFSVASCTHAKGLSFVLIAACLLSPSCSDINPTVLLTLANSGTLYDKVQGTRTYSWDIMHFFVKKISTPKSWSNIVMLYIIEKQINFTFRKLDFGPL